MVCKLHHTMSGTYTQEKCGEDSTPLSNAPEARCGLRSRIRRSAGHIFSLLREKIWKKRALERFYSAYAPEKACRSVLRFVVTQAVVRTPFGRPSDWVSQAHDIPCESLRLRPLNI